MPDGTIVGDITVGNLVNASSIICAAGDHIDEYNNATGVFLCTVSGSNANYTNIAFINITNIFAANQEIFVAALPELIFRSDRDTDGQGIGRITFFGEDDLGADREYARIFSVIDDSNATAPMGVLRFQVLENDTSRIYLTMDASSELIITSKDLATQGFDICSGTDCLTRFEFGTANNIEVWLTGSQEYRFRPTVFNITDNKLAGGVCTNGQIMKYNSASDIWDCAADIVSGNVGNLTAAYNVVVHSTDQVDGGLNFFAINTTANTIIAGPDRAVAVIHAALADMDKYQSIVVISDFSINSVTGPLYLDPPSSGYPIPNGGVFEVNIKSHVSVAENQTGIIIGNNTICRECYIHIEAIDQFGFAGIAVVIDKMAFTELEIGRITGSGQWQSGGALIAFNNDTAEENQNGNWFELNNISSVVNATGIHVKGSGDIGFQEGNSFYMNAHGLDPVILIDANANLAWATFSGAWDDNPSGYIQNQDPTLGPSHNGFYLGYNQQYAANSLFHPTDYGFFMDGTNIQQLRTGDLLAYDNMAWNSSQAFRATLDHAITQDRTYTFQNANGTIAFLSDTGGGGGGSDFPTNVAFTNITNIFTALQEIHVAAIPELQLRSDRTVDGQGIGRIDFDAQDDLGASQAYGRIFAVIDDSNATSPAGTLRFQVTDPGGENLIYLTMDGSSESIILGRTLDMNSFDICRDATCEQRFELTTDNEIAVWLGTQEEYVFRAQVFNITNNRIAGGVCTDGQIWEYTAATDIWDCGTDDDGTALLSSNNDWTGLYNNYSGGQLTIVNLTEFTPRNLATWRDGSPILRLADNLDDTGNTDAAVIIEMDVSTDTGSTTGNYEKMALFIDARTADPSNVTFSRDLVGIDVRGQVSPGNLDGRVWCAFISATTMDDTADGILKAVEIHVRNDGIDEWQQSTLKGKSLIHLVAEGNDITNAIVVSIVDPTTSFHNFLHIGSNDIGSNSSINDSFINWVNNFAIWGNGSMTLYDSELYDFDIADETDRTKQVNLDLSGISTATTRTVIFPNSNLTLAGQDFANNFTVDQRIWNTDLPDLNFQSERSVDGQGIGRINWIAEDDAGAVQVYARITGVIDDSDAALPDGTLVLAVTEAGSEGVPYITFDGTGAQVVYSREINMQGLDILNLGTLRYNNVLELTLASNVITPTQSFHMVDTENNTGCIGAPTTPTEEADCLVQTITAGVAGETIILRSANGNRDITFCDQTETNCTGNLNLGGNRTLTGTDDMLTLIFHQAAWAELSFANNE